MLHSPLESHPVEFVNERIAQIETALDADLLTIYSPITGDIDRRIKNAIEKTPAKRKKSL